MRLLINLFCFLIFLAGLSLMFAGCDSRTSTVHPNSNDVNALNQLHENSAWSFQQSHVGLKAYGDGAVEIEIEGEALQKGEDQEGSLLLPIVLTSELPPYYRIAEGTEPKLPELLAYQATDGLWCIAAQVPLSSQPQQSAPVSVPSSGVTSAPTPSPDEIVDTASQRTAVKLRVLMVSPTFSTRLPLLIPVGQSRAPVDTTVSLPNHARFSSLEVASDSQDHLTTLTVLPPTVSGSEIVAAARLTPGTATAWNFFETHLLDITGGHPATMAPLEMAHNLFHD